MKEDMKGKGYIGDGHLQTDQDPCPGRQGTSSKVKPGDPCLTDVVSGLSELYEIATGLMGLAQGISSQLIGTCNPQDSPPPSDAEGFIPTAKTSIGQVRMLLNDLRATLTKIKDITS